MKIVSLPVSSDRFIAAVIMTASVLVLAGCSSTSSAVPAARTTPLVSPPSSTAATPLPSSPADSAEKEAIAAYVAMWQDTAAAATTSDWQSPRITQHATGDAALVISKALYTDHLNGVVSKGAPNDNPRVISVQPPADPNTIMISDCGDSTNWLQYTTNGQPFGSPGGHRQITAEVKKQPGRAWKVTRFAVEALGSCE